VTKDVSFTVSGYECGDTAQCVLDATATFRRSEFGMNRYLTLVSDSVRLVIHGVATAAERRHTDTLLAAAGQIGAAQLLDYSLAVAARI